MGSSKPSSGFIPLREIAFSRSGDKGDTINVSVIPYDKKHWELIREQVTIDVVRRLYAGLVNGEITRYELPGTRALNFVMKGALAGGVSMSLRVDGHGKSFQSLILEAEVSAPTA
ncbi:MULTISPECIES: hypothetical protein [unclassified Mesorhizobium]|uniref:AtuA-related protein n=1 Tax=unclassified Mesorhizobium TaxID=325217 RepID=UPI001938A8B9|nr:MULTISPECIES: hypothetical protein [unclassified Mesorhizobium]BCG90189.1 hypothetical protein MesoLj113c_62990 [Mesorhizobium sp. 113-3-9]